jgi:GT2 family glycosyltransferase
LLNSDTVVPPGAIDRLAAELDQDPAIAVIGPRLVDGSGRQSVGGRMIGPFNELRQKIRNRRPALVDRLTRRRHCPTG